MKKESLLFRTLVLVVAMMCALGVSAQEAYAVYTADNTTLSFYYDNDRGTRTGTTYGLNDGPSDPGWVTDFTNLSVKQVVFDPSFESARPTSTFYWFSGMRNLESITGMEYLNTSEVVRMDNMFNRCYKLTSLNLEKFNIAKVTDMSEMFRSCGALQTIYVGDGWKMSQMALTSSHNVFKDCTSLVGGRGTAYDAAHVDADYAHVDGGPDNPGYFSEKPAPMRGDVNSDGAVDIADVVLLIDVLLVNGTAPENADCDQSGIVDIADVSALIDYMLTGSWSDVEP